MGHGATSWRCPGQDGGAGGGDDGDDDDGNGDGVVPESMAMQIRSLVREWSPQRLGQGVHSVQRLQRATRKKKGENASVDFQISVVSNLWYAYHE